MIRIIDILKEFISPTNDDTIANTRIDDLPKGRLFDDAKNISNIFTKSQRSWSEVVETYEKHRNSAKVEYADIADIHITQPNIQSNKVKKLIADIDNIPNINVVEFQDGEKAIYDGHHRLVANWALGNAKIKVNIIRA